MDAESEVQSTKYRVQSKKKKSGWSLLAVIVTVVTAGCGTARQGDIVRIALVAPFEGRYQEIGYNAYYAAKLALADYGRNDIELVAVDDGGTVQSAVERAQALAGDPLVKAVIAMGYNATDSAVQAAFGNTPVLIVGDWGTTPETSNIFMMTNPQNEALWTLPQSERTITNAAQLSRSIVGNEVLALEQFPLLTQRSVQATIISSGSLPDARFTERYVNSAEFTPQPGLLATLTYDSTNLLIQAITSAKNSDLTYALENSRYKGLNGNIEFVDGYWTDAPIHYFSYDSVGNLVPVNSPVE